MVGVVIFLARQQRKMTVGMCVHLTLVLTEKLSVPLEPLLLCW